MREVAVIGVGQTKFGDHVNVGAAELFASAFRDAVADVEKGFAPGLIEDAYIGSLGVGGGQPGNFAAAVGQGTGLSGIPITRVEKACASSALPLEALSSRSPQTFAM
jgi:acetyl-CoA acetyltransferase